MTNEIWNLDLEKDYTKEKRIEFLEKNGYDKGTHPDYKIGDIIQFMTGFDNDILAQASIKGIDENDLYVYIDCYWFPINALDQSRQIKKV